MTMNANGTSSIIVVVVFVVVIIIIIIITIITIIIVVVVVVVVVIAMQQVAVEGCRPVVVGGPRVMWCGVETIEGRRRCVWDLGGNIGTRADGRYGRLQKTGDIPRLGGAVG